ncbi:MAG: TonB C-terminal domain-containing protein [Rhodomicrobium sp.]|nr:TonB C-terminal domain-containing protein [Rhodomicrobium sp.]
MRAYKNSVRTHLAARKPAGRYGSGRLVVGFTLSRSGKVVSAKILKSSGKADMDESALQAVYSSAPFPKPPRGIRPADRRFCDSIPLRLRLSAGGPL